MDAIDLKECRKLIGELEKDPERMPLFYNDLERAIFRLMDATFESKALTEKTILASTEMRARLVLERFRKSNTN